MRYTSLVLLAAAALAGCGTPSASALPPRPATGIVEGSVVVAPTCPVERPGQTCFRPLPAAHVRFTSIGSNLSTDAVADGTGHYRLALPAGTYFARVLRPAGGMYAQSLPAKFEVRAHSTTELNLTYDSGIR